MMQAYSKFTIVTLIIFIFCGLKIQQTSAQVASEVDACKKTPGYIAIVACSRLIQSDPKNSDPYYQRGLRFYFLGVYDRAISDFDETIRLNPKHADAYHSRGWIWHKTDLDKAIADYSEAIKFDSKDAAAYNDRGNAFYQKGEYEKAIADYKEAIKKFPKFSAANANLMAASDALKALVATANPRLSELLFVMSPRWYLIKGVATDGNSLMFRKYAIPSLKGQFGGIEQFKNTLSFACQRDSRFMNFVIFHIPKFADPNFNTDQWKPHYPVHISYDELRTKIGRAHV